MNDVRTRTAANVEGSELILVCYRWHVDLLILSGYYYVEKHCYVGRSIKRNWFHAVTLLASQSVDILVTKQ